MDYEETVKLLDNVLPRLLSKMNQREKLKMILHVAPRILEDFELSSLDSLIDRAFPDEDSAAV